MAYRKAPVHRRAKPRAVRPSILTKSLKKLYFKSRKLDGARQAKAPGWRPATKTHKKYYEARVNRSDRVRRASKGHRL